MEVSRGLTLEEAAERRRRKGSCCLPGNPRQVARRNASLPPTALPLMEKKKGKKKERKKLPRHVFIPDKTIETRVTRFSRWLESDSLESEFLFFTFLMEQLAI